MNGLLERFLKQFKFYCIEANEEEEFYVCFTGKNTMLAISGKYEYDEKSGDDELYYDFYKETFYKNYPNKPTIYGEHLDCEQIKTRVEKYFKNREKYLKNKKEGKELSQF